MLPVQARLRKAAVRSFKLPNPGTGSPTKVPMTRKLIALAALILASQTQAAGWEAGRHYTVLAQPQRTNVPAGKVEVLEVFSYGCPACDNFEPHMKRIKAALPANAHVVYLHASWNKAEAWPLFQRSYITAQSLGVADRAHQEMYKAIWQTGELGVVDKATGRLKTRLPTIEQVAKFYERVTGVKAADFVNASKSFGVDMKVNQSDAQILAMRITGTPSIVVNGKYVLNSENLPTIEDYIAVIKFLVAKETKPAAAAAPTAPARKN